MSHDNYGSQSGDVINLGIGDFRGANVNVGGNDIITRSHI